MKRSIVGCAVAVALVFICARMNGAQSTAPSPAVIPSGHVVIMQLDTPLHTRTTKKGDKVEFHTAADVIVDNQVLIPNQSLIRGEVKTAKRAGLLHGRAELQLRFVNVQLPDGTVIPLQAAITRAGFDPVDAKNGEEPTFKGETGSRGNIKALARGGAQGALIGIYRGPRGALYGAAAGVAATSIGMMLRRGPDIDLPRSTMFEARFEKSLAVPAASVLAQNIPAAGALANSETTAINMSAIEDQPAATNRPILKRPETFPPTEQAALSTQEPSPDAPPASPIAEAKTPQSATEGLTISIKVKMVQVDTLVKDRSGKVMANLRMEDFRVYEDNVSQELASFSQDELPLAVALVVDRSGSVAPYISELRRIATRALYNLKPQDEVCLFTFAGDVQRLEDLTSDRQKIADGIDRIHASGTTDIVDALYAAVRYLANAAPDRRHAVILISDNEQTNTPSVNEREVITMAQERDAVVYSLKTSGTPMPLANQLPSMLWGDFVNKIAQESGGEVIKVTKVSALDNALDSVISRLRTRYSLGYYPSGSSQGGAFHTITVRLSEKFGKSGSDYVVHAKRGYYAVQSAKSITGAEP
jgi:Ca-activated chloride channel homolog